MRLNKGGLILLMSILALLILMQSFWQQISGEVIGGILGGLIVLPALFLWYKYTTFRIRFHDANEPITAEHMNQYTAVRTNVGVSVFNVCIKPRIGIDLEQYGFAFFERGKLPWLVGRRRIAEEVVISKMKWYQDNRAGWKEITLEYDNDGSFACGPRKSLAAGSRLYLQLEVKIRDSLKSWEGVLSFLLFYQRNGNPERKHVRTKIIVLAPDQRRPLRSMFKKILKCEPKLSVLDKASSQP